MIKFLTRFRAGTILTILVLSLASCKKNDADNKDEAPNVVTASLTAHVDGTTFTATTLDVAQQDGVLTLTGIAAGDKTLTVILNTTSEGTYTINFDDLNVIYTVGAVTWTSGPTASGSITIADNANGKLSGSFQAVLNELIFTGTNVNITAGSFEGIAFD